MKKRWMTVLSIICVGIAFLLAKKAAADERRVIEVLANVGTVNQISVVEYSGEYSKEYLNPAQQGEYLTGIARELGITDDIIVSEKAEDSRKEVKLYKKTATSKTVLRMVTIQNGVAVKQYMIANISLQGGIEQAMGYRKKLTEILTDDTRDIKSSANIIGTYDGELSMAQKDAITDGILSKLKAKTVTENRTEELYTVYGYTPAIEECKSQEDQKVNINIAAYYSDMMNETYIYAAIPVIGLDY